MVDQTRNSLLVVAIVLLIFVSSANGTYTQCMMSLVNSVVYEGTLNTMFDCSTGASWSVLATSNSTKTYSITNFNGTVSPTFRGFYVFNETGLIVLKATTYGYGKENATAGIYIVSFDPENANNKTAIKLVVIQSGPTCSCIESTSGSVNISCTIVYADHTVAPINAVMSCTANGQQLYNGTTPYRGTSPIPSTPPECVWSSTPYVIVNNTIPTTYDCLMTFGAPVGGPAYISRTLPDFSATRQVVCGQTTSASPTTSVQPTTSRKSLITTTKPLIPTTKPTTTTTQTQKTTQIPRTTTGKLLLIRTTRPSSPTSKSPTIATKAQTTALQTLSVTSKQTTTYTQTSPKTIESQITTPIKSRATTSLATTMNAKLSAITTTRLGQFISTSSLATNLIHTKKPINTAAVAGSTNIALECASIYGTDVTRWSFTPLNASTNDTIWLASGYQLFPTYQQNYELSATANSSTLIVRQLSNETEGNYSCYDGVESASALLLVIPIPISVGPLFGPIAGGTTVTIIASAGIDNFSKYVGTNVTGVRHVYIGKDFSSTSVSLLPTDSSTFEVVAVTPRTTEASIRQPLPIIIEFSPTSFNMSFNKFFVYLPNPVITGIFPNSFLVTGGTLIDVFGQSFSSVSKPIIQLTVVITRADQNSPTSNTSTRICTVPPGNNTYMQCPMPPLNLPDDFLEILDSFYNFSTIRKRRSKDPINHIIANSHSLLSRMKRDANVLTLTGPNGIDRAEIYLGFILDGYKEYENINDALPDTRLIFYSPPEINSSDELIEFDLFEDELVYVKGRYMMRGCRLRDYVVHIGNQICINSDLHDNQLSCRPPTVEPSLTVNDTIYCGQYLSISVTIGYKQYQYACLKYADHSWRLALIIGLTVGLAVFAFLLAILITVCIARRRRKKVSQKTQSHQQSGGPELRHRREQPESQQNVNIIHKRQNTKTLYKPYDDYLPYGRAVQPDSHRVYDRQIHDTDDDIEPHFEYFAPSDHDFNRD